MSKLDKNYTVTKYFYFEYGLLLCCSAEICNITKFEGSLDEPVSDVRDIL